MKPPSPLFLVVVTHVTISVTHTHHNITAAVDGAVTHILSCSWDQHAITDPNTQTAQKCLLWTQSLPWYYWSDNVTRWSSWSGWGVLDTDTDPCWLPPWQPFMRTCRARSSSIPGDLGVLVSSCLKTLHRGRSTLTRAGAQLAWCKASAFNH